MPTRRQFIAGLGSAAISAGIVSSTTAFSATSSSAKATFTVVSPDLVELRAANDPPIHVVTTDDGIVTKLTPGGNTGLNQHAVTQFVSMVEIMNVSPIDLTGIYFDFEAESNTLTAETVAEIEQALSVTAGTQTLETAGKAGDDLLAVSNDDSVTGGILSSSESIPFGLQIDLMPGFGDSSLSELPDEDFAVTLSVIVTDE